MAQRCSEIIASLNKPADCMPFLQECILQKQLGQASDNVVFVLDEGIFDIPALVGHLKDGLSGVLGEFSSLAGDVVSSPKAAPVLQSVNAATALFGK